MDAPSGTNWSLCTLLKVIVTVKSSWLWPLIIDYTIIVIFLFDTPYGKAKTVFFADTGKKQYFVLNVFRYAYQKIQMV